MPRTDTLPTTETASLHVTMKEEEDHDAAGSDGGHHDEHHHHDGKVTLYISPMQRQRWGDPQTLPHTNWGDTFFDLFYVAA